MKISSLLLAQSKVVLFRNTLIKQVRLGIEDSPVSIFEPIDWNVIQGLAAQQGVEAIVVDGIERLPKNLQPPKDILLHG